MSFCTTSRISRLKCAHFADARSHPLDVSNPAQSSPRIGRSFTCQWRIVLLLPECLLAARLSLLRRNHIWEALVGRLNDNDDTRNCRVALGHGSARVRRACAWRGGHGG